MSDTEPTIVRRVGDEIHLDFTSLPELLFSLGQLPEILKLRETEQAKARLFPDIQPGHTEENELWHTAMDEDLRHLFDSATEIVVRDLDRMKDGIVTYPVKNLAAWMSALNQARLVLGALYGVEESDMARRDLDVREKRDVAILHVHMLGALLEELVGV